MSYNKGMISAKLANHFPPFNFSTATVDQINDTTKVVKDKYLTAAFISGADINRFGNLKEMLENNYLRSNKRSCPEDVIRHTSS